MIFPKQKGTFNSNSSFRFQHFWTSSELISVCNVFFKWRVMFSFYLLFYLGIFGVLLVLRCLIKVEINGWEFYTINRTWKYAVTDSTVYDIILNFS